MSCRTQSHIYEYLYSQRRGKGTDRCSGKVTQSRQPEQQNEPTRESLGREFLGLRELLKSVIWGILGELNRRSAPACQECGVQYWEETYTMDTA